MQLFLTAFLIGFSLLVAIVAEITAPTASSLAVLFTLPILLALLLLSPRGVIGISCVALASYIVASLLGPNPALNVVAINLAGLVAVAALGHQASQRQNRTIAAQARLILRHRELAQRFAQLSNQEAQVHNSLSGTPVSVFGQDERLRYTWEINPPVFLSGTSLVGKSEEEVFSPEQAAQLREIKRTVMRSGTESRHEIDVQIDGHTVTYDLTVQPVRAQDHTIVGVTSGAVDISPWTATRNRLQSMLQREEVARAEAEAEQHRFRRMYQRVHQFVASVAHELRQPLTTIFGAAQRLERSAWTRLNESEQRSIRMLLDAGRRAQRMVGDLRATSTIETGNFDVQPTHTDLVDVVQHVIEELPEADRMRVVFSAPSSLEGVWDRDRIMQVASNLIANAIKYSGTGSNVDVMLRQEGTDALLSVRDEGPGIAPADQTKLFEAYTRLEDAATVEGSGLGLYVARRIVEAHGGHIWVRSEPGHGATFCVSLPQGDIGDNRSSTH